MKKKKIAIALLLFALLMTAGCGTPAAKTSESAESSAAASSSPTAASQNSGSTTLADGVYSAEFTTDSSMFHVNEAKNGKGVLTVKDGKKTIHVSLASENIVNLFLGKAEDAKKDGAGLLQPTKDAVTYSDGTTEEVYGFDIPVPTIGEDFDLAIIGTKGTWYDHKVTVSNPEPVA